MRKILVGLFDQRMDPTVIYCDNDSCIKLYENLVFHDRSKPSTFGIIISKTVWQGGSCCCNIFRPRSKMMTFSLRHFQSVNSSSIDIGSRWQIIPFLLGGSVEMWQQEYSNFNLSLN